MWICRPFPSSSPSPRRSTRSTSSTPTRSSPSRNTKTIKHVSSTYNRISPIPDRFYKYINGGFVIVICGQHGNGYSHSPHPQNYAIIEIVSWIDIDIYMFIEYLSLFPTIRILATATTITITSVQRAYSPSEPVVFQLLFQPQQYQQTRKRSQRGEVCFGS